MPRRRRETSLFASVLCTALAAWASTAGAAATVPTGGTPATPAPAAGGLAYGTPGQPQLLAPAGTMLGRTLHVRGTLLRAAGARVMVQRLDPVRGWLDVASTRVRPSGRFLARWRTDRSGRFTLRAARVIRGDRVRASAAPVTQVTVYRVARATWYGPGFFGRQTACGHTLTPELVGVAHRTLSCGELVEILHQGRTLVVPVVDRGPYNPGATWDLTQAAAAALGFTGAGPIGYIPASAAPAG